MLFDFVAELFADAFSATRMLADKVVNVYSQQPTKEQVSNLHNATAGTASIRYRVLPTLVANSSADVLVSDCSKITVVSL